MKSPVTFSTTGLQPLNVCPVFFGSVQPKTEPVPYSNSPDQTKFPSPSSRVMVKLSSWSAFQLLLASVSGVHTACKVSPVVTGVSSVHTVFASTSRRPLRLYRCFEPLNNSTQVNKSHEITSHEVTCPLHAGATDISSQVQKLTRRSEALV